jgi:autotransporter-associated beta strand protein
VATFGIPSQPDNIATFDSSITTSTAYNGGVVNQNISGLTIGGITLGNTSFGGYTITGSAITLDNGSLASPITITSGTHTIATPLTLVGAGLAVTTTNSSDKLILSNSITSGATSTYTAAAIGMTVSGPGTVILSGTGSFSGTTTVNSPSTLGGTGSLAGPAVVASGATLAPAGTSTTPAHSPLTLTGGAALNGTVRLNIAASTSVGAPTSGITTPGSGTYDEIVYGGTLSGAPTLVLTDSGYKGSADALSGDKFWLVDGLPSSSSTPGSAVPTGLFGTTITDSAGVSFLLTYNIPGDPEASGNDVLATATVSTPEPAALGLLGIGALGLLARRRRRIAKRK